MAGMNDTIREIKFKIHPTDDENDEELEQITRMFVNELTEIEGIDKVSYITTQEKIPEGARAGEIVALGEIVISIITSGALVASLNLIKSWLENKKRKIKITTEKGSIEGENLSKEQIDRILDKNLEK